MTSIVDDEQDVRMTDNNNENPDIDDDDDDDAKFTIDMQTKSDVYRPFALQDVVINEPDKSIASSCTSLVLASNPQLAKRALIPGNAQDVRLQAHDIIAQQYAALNAKAAQIVISDDRIDEVGAYQSGSTSMLVVMLDHYMTGTSKKQLAFIVTPASLPSQCTKSGFEGEHNIFIEPSGAVLLPIEVRTPKSDVPAAFFERFLSTISSVESRVKYEYWIRTAAAARITTGTTFVVTQYNLSKLPCNPMTGTDVVRGDVLQLSGLSFKHTCQKSGQTPNAWISAFASVSSITAIRSPNKLIETLQRLRATPNIASLDLAHSMKMCAEIEETAWEWNNDEPRTAVIKPGWEIESNRYTRSLREYPIVEPNPCNFMLPIGRRIINIDETQTPFLSVIGKPIVRPDTDDDWTFTKNKETLVCANFGVIVIQSTLGNAEKEPHRMTLALTATEATVRSLGTTGTLHQARLVSSIIPHMIGVLLVDINKKSSSNWAADDPSAKGYVKFVFQPYYTVIMDRSTFEIPFKLVKQILSATTSTKDVIIPVDNPLDSTPECGVICLHKTRYCGMPPNGTPDLLALEQTGRYSYHILCHNVVTPEMLAERATLTAKEGSRGSSIVSRLNSFLLFTYNTSTTSTSSGEKKTIPLWNDPIPPAHLHVSKIGDAPRLIFAIDKEVYARALALVDFEPEIAKRNMNAALIDSPKNAKRSMSTRHDEAN